MRKIPYTYNQLHSVIDYVKLIVTESEQVANTKYIVKKDNIKPYAKVKVKEVKYNDKCKRY